jgi:transposase
MFSSLSADALFSHSTHTIYLALELSRRSWLVALHAPDAAKIELHRLPAGDGQAVLDLLARIRTRVERRTGVRPHVSCCYEAGRDGFWLHRLLEAHGITSHVMDPSSLQVDRRARRAKTDRLDAQALLRALMAWSRGEPKVCSMVRPPSPDEEDARRPSRERATLLQERIRLVNRIKGLCATQGIDDYEPLRPDRRPRLAQLITGDGRPLPPRLSAEIARQLDWLELVLRHLAEVETRRDAEAAAAVKAASPSKLGALLHVRSIGPELATVLDKEVFYRCFASRRHVAAYAGLTPSPFASGRRSREQGITKAGNARARKALIELAWLWLRNQPDSALAVWFRSRVGSATGRVRRIAIVALARKLLILLWRYVETGSLPADVAVKP